MHYALLRDMLAKTTQMPHKSRRLPKQKLQLFHKARLRMPTLADPITSKLINLITPKPIDPRITRPIDLGMPNQ
jgi:hypothetical protein